VGGYAAVQNIERENDAGAVDHERRDVDVWIVLYVECVGQSRIENGRALSRAISDGR